MKVCRNSYPRLLGGLAIVLLAAACGGTETDNPNSGDSGDPPRYESPIDFRPGEPAIPPCPGELDGKPSGLPLWGSAEAHVVGVGRYGELRWLDASDPAAPGVLATLSIEGVPRQLQLESGTVAHLVVDEQPALREREAPDPRSLDAVTKLLRLELAGTGAVRRVAELAVEGEFWRLIRHGELTWIMSARLREPLPACDRTPYRCGGPAREALLLTGVRFDGEGLREVQRVELPMNVAAWAAEEGFASFVADADGESGRLHHVRFAPDGTLGEPGSLTLSAPPIVTAPLSLAASLLRVFVYDPSDGSADLLLYDLAAQSSQPIASVPIAHQSPNAARFLPSVVYVPGSYQQPALRIDHVAPATPVVVSFPAPHQLVLPLAAANDGERVLALGPASTDGTGPLAVALLQVQDGAIATLDELALPQMQGFDLEWLARSFTTDGTHVWLAWDRQAHALQVDENGLRALPPSLPQAYGGELLALGEFAYAPDRDGLAIADLAAGTSSRLEWEDAEEVRAVVEAGGYQAMLVRDREGAVALVLARDGERHSLPVAPVAEHLLDAGEHLLVVSMLPRSECEQTGLDCDDYAPGVAVVALGETPPRVAARVELPRPAGSGTDDAQGVYWQAGEDVAPLRLSDGRYVFVGELDQQCLYEADCEALGIDYVPFAEANAAVATGDCAPPPPGAEPIPCAQPPPPTVYGRERRQLFYALDHAADPPRFGPPADARLDDPDGRFALPRIAGQRLLATRLEPAGEPGGERVARFVLERFVAGEADGWQALPALNVPGYPVTLDAEGTHLLSAEPAPAAGGVVLYRLELTENGALVRDERALDARLDELVARGEHAYVLHHSGEGCDAVTSLQPVALADLELGSPLELPGASYVPVDADASRIVLRGPSGGFAVVDAADPAAPRLEVFLRPWPPVYAPRLAGDTLLGPSPQGGALRIPLGEAP